MISKGESPLVIVKCQNQESEPGFDHTHCAVLPTWQSRHIPSPLPLMDVTQCKHAFKGCSAFLRIGRSHEQGRILHIFVHRPVLRLPIGSTLQIIAYACKPSSRFKNEKHVLLIWAHLYGFGKVKTPTNLSERHSPSLMIKAVFICVQLG